MDRTTGSKSTTKNGRNQKGGFQFEFVSISRVINHMTCYKFECSHWLKLQHSDWRANLVKINFAPMRALEL